MKIIRKIISLLVLLTFAMSTVMPVALASEVPFMPEPGVIVAQSPAFMPAHLRGMTMNPKDPFQFDFIIHRGDTTLTKDQKQEEYSKLIKYFLAALAVPDTDQWVNLSPYEQGRIIPDIFGMTEMGRDLLAQDYFLKQLSSSLTDPNSGLGATFWSKIYEEAYQKFGTTDVPTNMFNKVWIVPDKAVVYEKGNTVYVLENHLKVMTERDYLAMKNSAVEGASADDMVASISSKVITEVILPALEKEVNENKSFAPLRQVYSGMLLATWYKRALKQSILGQVYADKGKVKGVDQPACRQAGIPCETNQQIYDQYVRAFKKGVFSFIKEDLDKYTDEMIPRKYFSGGTVNAYAKPGVMQFENPGKGDQESSQIEGDSDLAQVALFDATEGSDRREWERAEKEFRDGVQINPLSVSGVQSDSRVGSLLEAWVVDLSGGKNTPISEMSNRMDPEGVTAKAWRVLYSALTAGRTDQEIEAMGMGFMDLLQFGKRREDFTKEGERAGVTKDSRMMEFWSIPLTLQEFNARFSIAVKSSGRAGAAVDANIALALIDFESSFQSMLKKEFFRRNEQYYSFLEGAKDLSLIITALNDPKNSKYSFLTMFPESWIQKGSMGMDMELKPDVANTLRGFLSVDVFGNVTLNEKDAAQDQFTKGGIDFAESNLNMEIKRDGDGVPLPVSQQNLDSIHIEGLVPVILDIRPATAVMPVVK